MIDPDKLDRESDLGRVLSEIEEWWRKTSDGDLAATLGKARTYDGIDLEIMGKAMESLLPSAAVEDMTNNERTAIGLEMACAFYAMGKLARLFGAYRQGTTPGPDHWFDLGVYSMMARRIRNSGRWT